MGWTIRGSGWPLRRLLLQPGDPAGAEALLDEGIELPGRARGRERCWPVCAAGDPAATRHRSAGSAGVRIRHVRRFVVSGGPPLPPRVYDSLKSFVRTWEPGIPGGVTPLCGRGRAQQYSTTTTAPSAGGASGVSAMLTIVVFGGLGLVLLVTACIVADVVAGVRRRSRRGGEDSRTGDPGPRTDPWSVGQWCAGGVPGDHRRVLHAARRGPVPGPADVRWPPRAATPRTTG